jgi:ribonuclease-3
MVFSNLLSLIRLLFVKDKELYVFIHKITGYYPRDISIYQLALVHRSKPVRMPDGRWANNERLEFLGDAVLDCVVAEYLYTNYPKKHEGFLTSTRAKIVQRESLNRVGNVFHIDTPVLASAHSTSHNSYISGNAVEALVGAVYLDQGYKRCRRFIIKRIIQDNFDLNDLVRTELNFKSRLIEWTQKYRVSIEFELIDTYTDSDNNPIFKTAVMLGGIFAADATGYSKKESHQGASKRVLDRLNSDPIFKEQVLSTATAPPAEG